MEVMIEGHTDSYAYKNRFNYKTIGIYLLKEQLLLLEFYNINLALNHED